MGNNLRAITVENLCHKIVEEELESAKKRIFIKIKGLFKDGNQNSSTINMKLQFKNGISQVILTGEEIKGQGKNPLELVLVDESTGNIVDVGLVSSATVEILLLKGESNASEGDNWSVEQFNEIIVRETEQKKPLLAGKQRIKLQNGIGFLENINFRHHATKMRPSVFKLGARVVNTFDRVRVKEAKTESFIVKDFRNKYYTKHETPSLSDEVFRLKNIRKGGRIEKRLQDHKICTVENFLIQRLIDPEGLKTILNLGEKKWKLTVANALACPTDKRMSYYTNEQKTMGFVFDLAGQIL
ncbi:hypothetical protein CDL12_01288 [Handroanthus impetiginosus]|uniref:CALMODULIN-BINDING PROTEIN60 n=1 Tax=Handroanthus impetiginosus TaxID=429701 RepID=A0A2G9I877_9LAMI|nr:hypothetical protein CDL12_01288 [Handroanthus impetiginosus]